jgi:thiol:disulfide interchange protein DsbA
MKSRFTAVLIISALLAGCGADAPPASAPAAAPASAPAAAASSTPAAAVDPAPASSPGTSDSTAAPAPDSADAAATPPAAEAPTPVPAATPAVVAAAPTGPEPREGIDYQIIDPPQPMSQSPGKIEVAEVFAYYCIHCSTLQAKVNEWKPTLPADVEFRYVPMAHGQSEPFARGFYAAEAMGELARTHDGMFKAVAVERKVEQGTIEELADLYADMGVDREALLATSKSFAVNAQIARNQKSVTRWAIEATPTFVVAGRYRATSTPDRGHDGLLSTVEHLVARERAAGTSTAR